MLGTYRGALRVETEPGRGSVFRVLLPALAGSTQDLAAPARSAAGGRILLACDQPLVRRASRAILELAGYTVDAVSGGSEAIQALSRDPAGFRLALVDLHAPDLDLQAILRALRRLRPDQRVLMAGAPVDGAAKVDPRTGWLAKPFSRDQLLGAVVHVLA
jgi:CheY-like chemotaxis protein